MRSGKILGLLTSIFFSLGANADTQGAYESLPLFADATTLTMTLEIPMAELRPGETLPEPLVGKVHYATGNEEHTLSVKVSTRGHSRLELCDLPPLKLNFSREELPGTLFSGQNKLKLVTHCQSARKFTRYLQHEYALYKVYSRLTDASFRVRRVEITYRDSAGRVRETTQPAFLIESDGEVASRLGYQEVEVPEVASAALDPDSISLLGIFQYFAGNTDWSLRKGRGSEGCCHNGLLLQKPSGDLVIVPYDFDQAGLVNADYALPARGLGIRSTRTRLFRGLCTGEKRIESAIALMNERRAAIEAEFPEEGPMKNSNRRALRYINKFYKTVNDPKKLSKAIDEDCRGEPGIWDEG